MTSDSDKSCDPEWWVKVAVQLKEAADESLKMHLNSTDSGSDSIGLLLDNRMKAAIEEVCRDVFKEEFQKAKLEIFKGGNL